MLSHYWDDDVQVLLAWCFAVNIIILHFIIMILLFSAETQRIRSIEIKLIDSLRTFAWKTAIRLL